MSRSIKAGAIVIGLLMIIAVTHTVTNSTLDDLAPQKKKTPTTTTTEENHGEKGTVQLPEPMGSPDALVKVRVYVTSDNDCDTSTLDKMKDLAKKYGDAIYVTFGDMLDKDTLKEAQLAKIGCKSGLTINGKNKFILPERGLKGAILLDGPTGQTNYNMKDVEDIIVHLLQKKGVIDEEAQPEGQTAAGEEATSTEVKATGTASAEETPQVTTGDE